MQVNSMSSGAASKSNRNQGTLMDRNMLGKDDFLKLLTTQLRYQDPINPVDDKEFISQMAQFSSLEQMQNLNSVMQQSMEIQQRLTALTQATTMLGHVVELYTHEGDQVVGKVDAISFAQGWPLIVVDGKSYDFTEVVSIINGEVLSSG